MPTLTYDPLATVTVTGSPTSISFTSIPSTYTDLRLVLSGLESSSVSKRIQFNSDTGSNYGFVRLNTSGATPASQMTRTGEPTGIRFASDQIGDSTTIPMNSIFDIFAYKNTSWRKTILVATASNNPSAGYVQRTCGTWNSADTITTISLVFAGSQTWSAGSTATLYGIRTE